MGGHDKHMNGGGANWKNRTLFHGDNLKFLRAMNSESVDLIATDPPFNKGKDFHATPDSLAKGAKFQDRWRWEKDVHPEWLDQIKDDWPAVWEVIDAANAVYMRPTKKNLKLQRDKVGSDMGAFLCFIAVRLLEMRRILKPTGSIYLHCDPTASHYLKAAMDAIFGYKNFRNEIVWCYKSGGASTKHFSKKHDVLLYYTKTNNRIFHAQKEKSYMGVGYNTGNENVQLYTDDKYNAFGPYTLVNMKDWWNIPMIATSNKTERTGYPTQKPLKLYSRIIEASSNKGDIVFDPFAGCATTCVAAERMERQWIGIDLWDKAEKVLLERMDKEGMLVGGKQVQEGWLFPKDITFTKEIPERTDDKQEAVPFLQVKERVKEPQGPRWTRAEMYEHLLAQYGSRCQGCDRYFDDSRYLELDHNTPRSSGGLNHISNRILLCGPCNKLKSNIYTLIGLRRENKKRGYMTK